MKLQKFIPEIKIQPNNFRYPKIGDTYKNTGTTLSSFYYTILNKSMKDNREVFETKNEVGNILSIPINYFLEDIKNNILILSK